MAYCVNVVVDIKPIYLNKHYLFQNKIYYLSPDYLRWGWLGAGSLTTRYQLGVIWKMLKQVSSVPNRFQQAEIL